MEGASFTGAVTVRELGLGGMITLRGDLSSPAVAAAVEAATGRKVPGPRAILGDLGAGVAWMSPDELLVLVPYAEAARVAGEMTAALAGEHAMVVNVSDARAVFRVEGRGVRDVLAKGAPADLSSEALGPGEIRRTRMGQVAAAFWVSGPESFDLVCFRSVAGYMFDWLSTAAAEGSLPGYFD
jgi:sarcosine oxidase subunit gamma